ncbi:putative quinate permease [Termitomyces sp. J132]|nr:putative quinate permease [Termitomyces sp. J132]
MGHFSRVEDRPTPKEVYNWRVYSAAMISAFAAVMIGYDAAFIGTSIALLSFKAEFGLDKVSASKFALISANIVSLYQSFFGSIFGYPLGFFYGRKVGLLVSAIVFCIGVILQVVASRSNTGLGIIYAGRVIVGLAIGAASNLAPIYVAEISPPAIRGRLIGLYELCWQIGGVVGFWINYGVSINIASGRRQWLIAFAVQFIPGGLLFIGAWFLTESPRWLVSRDHNSQALKNLSYLRNLPDDHPYVVEEYESIERTIAHERGFVGAGFFGPLRNVLTNEMLIKRLFIGSSLFAWQNATGINAINYYSPTIFESIGITGTNTALLTTGVYGIIKLVGSLVWLLYLVDTLGRRYLLIVGSIGGGISMYYIGAYIAISKPATTSASGPVVLNAGGRSAVAFFYIWTIFYSPTWNGTPWVIGAEFFPQHVRTFTQACMAASNWLYGFLIARFTPQMFLAMGYGVYIFFASLMMLSIIYVFFILPETKQVPLERMEELFAPGLKPWRAHSVVMARVHEQNAATANGRTFRDFLGKPSHDRSEYS